MRQACVPCSNKARTLLALQRSTDVQNVGDEVEVSGAEEAFFNVDEGAESAFVRSATTTLFIQSTNLSRAQPVQHTTILVALYDCWLCYSTVAYVQGLGG